MHIVFTGNLPAHYLPHLSKGVTNFKKLLADALTDQGHDVVYMHPADVHNLRADQYDYLLVGLDPWFWSEPGVYANALELLAFVPENQLLCLMDDSSVQNTLNFGQGLRKWGATDLARLGAKRFQEGMFTTLVPCYDWGNPQRFIPGDVITFDPTGYQVVKDSTYVNSKKHGWIAAANKHTGDWFGKAGNEWPIIRYGKDEWLTEEQLFDSYSIFWGCLLGRTNPPSIGWWRNRLKPCAWADCIVVGHPSETKLYPEPYRLTAQDVEFSTYGTRQSMAYDQRQALKEHTWSAGKFRERIREVFA